jgi:hypothetical protein
MKDDEDLFAWTWVDKAEDARRLRKKLKHSRLNSTNCKDNSQEQSKRRTEMKDDEVENLFAYGWLDTAVAIALALIAMVSLFFLAGYLT